MKTDLHARPNYRHRPGNYRWAWGLALCLLLIGFFPTGKGVLAEGPAILITPSRGVLVPAFSPDILAYTCYAPFDADRVEFSVTLSEPEATWRVETSDGELGAGYLRTATITVEGPASSRVYTVGILRAFMPDRLNDAASQASIASALASRPTLDVYSPVLYVTSELLSAVKASACRVTLACELGSASFGPSDIRDTSTPCNLTLLAASPLEASVLSALPSGTQIFSTASQGELFGEVTFRVACTAQSPVHVYAYSPENAAWLSISGAISPHGGMVEFVYDTGSTFALSLTQIPGAGSSPYAARNTGSGSTDPGRIGDPGSTPSGPDAITWAIYAGLAILSAVSFAWGLLHGRKKKKAFVRELLMAPQQSEDEGEGEFGEYNGFSDANPYHKNVADDNSKE